MTRNCALYMTRGEQERTLSRSGFVPAAIVLERDGTVLFHVEAAAVAVPRQGDTV